MILLSRYSLSNITVTRNSLNNNFVLQYNSTYKKLEDVKERIRQNTDNFANNFCSIEIQEK